MPSTGKVILVYIVGSRLRNLKPYLQNAKCSMYTNTHRETYTHIHTYTHTYIHRHTQAYTQTYTHTHTHTHTHTQESLAIPHPSLHQKPRVRYMENTRSHSASHCNIDFLHQDPYGSGSAIPEKPPYPRWQEGDIAVR